VGRSAVRDGSSGQGTSICKFTPSHLDAVIQILRESPEAASWTREGFLESLNDRGSLALVSEAPGAVTGFLIGRLIGDQAEVLNLAVSPGSRRQGIATQLLEAALHDLQIRGAASAYLEVRESNIGAIAFYQRHDFAKVGRRKAYYTGPVEAAVTMMKKFAPD
jgi:[ribosomal protein S18]-alanine N-acetyltransferase